MIPDTCLKEINESGSRSYINPIMRPCHKKDSGCLYHINLRQTHKSYKTVIVTSHEANFQKTVR